jgi:hypothetical protein
MPWNGDQDDPRRRLLIKALAAGFFSSAVCRREASAQVLGARPAPLPPGKAIYRIEGEVLVNGQPATRDTPIAASATIETGKNSEVVYVVGESAFLQRSESHVTLETREADSMLVSGTQLLTGKILSVFPSGKPVRMTTRNASIGIRGTGVYTEADPEQTYFCTCYRRRERSDKPRERGVAPSQPAALHPGRGAAGAEHPRRTVHQSHRPGADADRGAGGPLAAVRVPE